MVIARAGIENDYQNQKENDNENQNQKENDNENQSQ
jgi:hypothetical protein